MPRAPPASDDGYAEEFLALYSRAVKDRLCGSGRVGVHLSGGLDSSSVAVLAARELRRQGRAPPLAFSLLPPVGDDGLAVHRSSSRREAVLTMGGRCMEGASGG